MIVRILGEGQFRLAIEEVVALNELDERLEAAIESDDEEAFRFALVELLDKVRSAGDPVALDAIVDSDLVLPHSDATVEEVREMLSEEGLIPGRTGDQEPAATE
jgi:hypothetical protein